jgi:hypothetical protein
LEKGKLKKFIQYYQSIVLKLCYADLIPETFLLGDKPDLLQNFSAKEVGEFSFVLKPSSF